MIVYGSFGNYSLVNRALFWGIISLFVSIPIWPIEYRKVAIFTNIGLILLLSSFLVYLINTTTEMATILLYYFIIPAYVVIMLILLGLLYLLDVKKTFQKEIVKLKKA